MKASGEGEGKRAIIILSLRVSFFARASNMADSSIAVQSLFTFPSKNNRYAG